MTCLHYSRDNPRHAICALGLYGGKPYEGNCLACIAKAQNNPEYAAALFARADRAHPDGIQRISGCCDRADQA